MKVTIGHASVDENGKAAGGVPGDQTGREVCIRNWYNGRWDVLIRPKDPLIAEKIASACEKACNNKCIGYNQSTRNTIRNECKKVDYDMSKINTKCACDCSSLVSTCVECAGISLPNSNLPTTRTLEKVLGNTNCFDIIKELKYLSQSSYLRRGDILVRAGHHTVVVLNNGAPEDSNISVPSHKPNVSSNYIYMYDVKLPLLRYGNRGTMVEILQRILNSMGYDCGKPDGIFGRKTKQEVMQYQKNTGLYADGEFGINSYNKLFFNK